MKPAPFIRHAPKTLDEALKILSRVASQDGRVLAGGQSLVPIMAFRLAKPAHLVDINEVAGLDKHRQRRKLSVDRRLRAARRFPQSRRRQPARQTSRQCRAPHRALSDPHARHVLRQPRARRSGLGMVPDRRHARRHHGGEEHARRAADRGKGFLRRVSCRPRLPRTNCLPKCGCRCWRATPNSASTNSTAAPAISPWRRRLSPIACRRQFMTDVHVGVGGAEPRPRRIEEAEAVLNGQRARRQDFPRRCRSCRRSGRSPGRSPDLGGLPPRSGARRGAPRAGAIHRHDRAHQRLGAEMGRPRHPAGGRPGADHRARPLHRRSAGGALGALCAQPGGRRQNRKHQSAATARWSSPPPT